jgi:phage terminase Nu1 subunit (DNA packaging protein)
MKSTQLSQSHKRAKSGRSAGKTGFNPHALTAPELARLLGLERTTPHKWAEAGCPTEKGRFDLARTFQWRVTRAEARADNSASKHDQALADFRRARAAREELALERDRGKLVSRLSVIRVLSKYFTNARNILTTLPSRLELLFPDTEHRSVARHETERVVDETLNELIVAGREPAISGSGETPVPAEAGGGAQPNG